MTSFHHPLHDRADRCREKQKTKQKKKKRKEKRMKKRGPRDEPVCGVGLSPAHSFDYGICRRGVHELGMGPVLRLPVDQGDEVRRGLEPACSI